jgi:ketosteroid isomerase-like protein
LARALASGALLLALLCLGGCGGGGSSTRSSSEASSQQSAPPQQNAEASIEGFGEEAEGSERAEVEGAFHSYLGAIAAGDEEAACSYLAARVTESLQQLAAKAKKEISCPQLLEALLSPQAAQIAEGQAEGEVTKIRVKGDTAFVVFHAPGARLYQLTLAREEGEWKATSLSASVLAPSLPG